jgi:predicted enzyme related to lactoylglutathione lyase
MTEPTTRAGRPVWVDLSTSDAAAARAFYADVLGWDVEVDPNPEYGGYAMARSGGFDVAGIGPAQPGAPTAWSLYLLTDDAASLGDRVADAGGTVVMPAMTVGDVGRMAVFTDPAGAFFSAWEPNTMAGFHTGVPGSFGWAELNARGVERDLDFYHDVFGWDLDPMDLPDGGVYTRLGLDGTNFGGAMEMHAGMPAEMPGYWLVYFAVDSVEDTYAGALAAGGAEILPPMPMPGGRFAIVRDPQGAAFAVLTRD